MESAQRNVVRPNGRLADADRYQGYWDDMPCYLSVHDRELRIIDGNRRFRADFGDRIGEQCFRVYKGRTEACPDCPVEATFADGKSHGSEQLLVTRSGREVPVMVYTTPFRDVSGEVTSVMEMHTDIGEVKSLQLQLRRSQERLAQLFEEVPCLITVQGPDRIIQHANRRFRETFGPAVGDHCYRVYKHREEQCLTCPMIDTFGDGQIREHEAAVVAADGRELDLLVTTAPIRGSGGEVESVIEMGVDITQMRELQSQLTSIGLLVGSISHGIKGLLTGLDGGIYMVNTGFEKRLPDRVNKGWEMVQRNVERIRSMVLDILYYAKDRELAITNIDLDAMLAELGQALQKRAADSSIRLELSAPEPVGCFAGDAAAIRAMLLNLLENSLDACRTDRARPNHTVRLAARRVPPWMVIEVSDDGIGMDRETRDKVFTLFFSSKGSKGTGLGLFISKKIIDKHGGTISVETEPGRGTRFLVRLPIDARPSTQPEPEGV